MKKERAELKKKIAELRVATEPLKKMFKRVVGGLGAKVGMDLIPKIPMPPSLLPLDASLPCIGLMFDGNRIRIYGDDQPFSMDRVVDRVLAKFSEEMDVKIRMATLDIEYRQRAIAAFGMASAKVVNSVAQECTKSKIHEKTKGSSISRVNIKKSRKKKEHP